MGGTGTTLSTALPGLGVNHCATDHRWLYRVVLTAGFANEQMKAGGAFQELPRKCPPATHRRAPRGERTYPGDHLRARRSTSCKAARRRASLRAASVRKREAT